jgi:hypothetical protein
LPVIARNLGLSGRYDQVRMKATKVDQVVRRRNTLQLLLLEEAITPKMRYPKRELQMTPARKKIDTVETINPRSLGGDISAANTHCVA